MNNMNRENVSFDMDGILVNYHQAIADALLKTPEIAYPQSQLKFFENLEPIDAGVKLYFKLKEYYDVDILTRPSVINPLSYMEKRLWVEKHLGFSECKGLIECYDKTRVISNYLIDDKFQTGKYAPAWTLIQLGSPQFKNWDAIYDYFNAKIYK